MKALAIVALVLAGICIVIPIAGPYIAVVASIMAVISFRSEALLSGIAIGLSIINTAFLSPTLMITDASLAVAEAMETGAEPAAGALFWGMVLTQIILLVIGVILTVTKKD